MGSLSPPPNFKSTSHRVEAFPQQTLAHVIQVCDACEGDPRWCGSTACFQGTHAHFVPRAVGNWTYHPPSRHFPQGERYCSGFTVKDHGEPKVSTCAGCPKCRGSSAGSVRLQTTVFTRGVTVTQQFVEHSVTAHLVLPLDSDASDVQRQGGPSEAEVCSADPGEVLLQLEDVRLSEEHLHEGNLANARLGLPPLPEAHFSFVTRMLTVPQHQDAPLARVRWQTLQVRFRSFHQIVYGATVAGATHAAKQHTLWLIGKEHMVAPPSTIEPKV